MISARNPDPVSRWRRHARDRGPRGTAASGGGDGQTHSPTVRLHLRREHGRHHRLLPGLPQKDHRRNRGNIQKTWTGNLHQELDQGHHRLDNFGNSYIQNSTSFLLFAVCSYSLRHECIIICVFQHSFYDSKNYEKILQGFVGQMAMSDTVRTPGTPKVAIVSTLVSEEKISPFIFRVSVAVGPR